MSELRIQADFRPLTRLLSDLDQQQVPFATANALTSCAKTAALAVRRRMPSVFDRPTPFTLNAVATKPARKNDLVARVYVKPIQAEYLAVQETGGSVDPAAQDGKAKTAGGLIATNAVGRDGYGNVPRGTFRREKRKPGVFVGKAKGKVGIFERIGKGLVIVLANLVRLKRYKPRFQFRETVEKTVRAVHVPAFKEAMARALATAKLRK